MAIICWDFDGTLAYSESLWSKNVYKSICDNFPENTITFADIKKCMSTGFTWHTPNADFTDFTGDKWWDYMNAHFELSYIKLGVPKDLAKKSAENVRELIKNKDNYLLFEDTISTLEECEKLGHTNIILSNNFPDLAEVLRNLNIDKYFDKIIVSANYGYDKPRIELFNVVKSMYNNENEFIMVGDNVNADIIGGNNAEMTTILVHKGECDYADYYFDNLSDILSVVK